MNSILKIDDLKKVNFEKIDINKYQQNDLKPSSVFILIFETIKGKEILFLKRSNTLEFHKGEICFPGGSFDLSDKQLLNTAYREVEEETGIKKKDIELKFSLNEQITRTRFSIKPFVGVIKKEVKINLDKNEIDNYFKLPLDVIENENNLRNYCFLEDENKLIYKPAFFCKGNLIWGATANILTELLVKI